MYCRSQYVSAFTQALVLMTSSWVRQSEPIRSPLPGKGQWQNKGWWYIWCKAETEAKRSNQHHGERRRPPSVSYDFNTEIFLFNINTKTCFKCSTSLYHIDTIIEIFTSVLNLYCLHTGQTEAILLLVIRQRNPSFYSCESKAAMLRQYNCVQVCVRTRATPYLHQACEIKESTAVA